jgi:outer membrane receptor protein involved in Fe transport
VATALSGVVLDRDRRGAESEENVVFDITDLRRTEVLGLRQDWIGQATSRQLLKWGFELREFETDYDYDGAFVFDDPLASIGHDSDGGVTVLHDNFDERQVGAYVADRLRVTAALTLELGLRHDAQTRTDQSLTSPRFNGIWAPDRESAGRFGWGRFVQSQRTYELQVEDGETGFHPTERSEHRILGYERAFSRGDGEVPRVLFRVEAYERRIDNPRPRYENLYEALNTFPEVEPDRVRIAPARSRARGAEIFLQGRPNERLGWFANYAYAEVVDFFEDGTEAPRAVDQRHSVNLDLDARLGRHWRLNLAWRYHSGWPTTALSTQPVDEGGEIVYEPVTGPLRGERLDSYHRLDARASRQFELPHGRLELFIDVQNLYDRDNLAGFDVEIDETTGAITRTPEFWPGILPSAGLTYRF